MLKVPRWITRKLSRYEICRNWQFLNHRKPQEVKLLIRNYVKLSYRSLYFTPSFHILLPLKEKQKSFFLNCAYSKDVCVTYQCLHAYHIPYSIKSSSSGWNVSPLLGISRSLWGRIYGKLYSYKNRLGK